MIKKAAKRQAMMHRFTPAVETGAPGACDQDHVGRRGSVIQ
jgi:hypothetical protein